MALLVVYLPQGLAEEMSLVGAERFGPESAVDGEGWANMYDPANNSMRLLPYVSIDGMAVYEGDILLGPVSDFQAPTTPVVNGVQNGVATRNLGSRWDDGIVYYDLNGHPGSSTILDAMADIEGKTSIRFIPWTSQSSHIRFINGSGCWSYIGQGTGVQDISLQSPGCVHRGVAEHEIFHALGVYHEQSRNDRDQYVTINFANISPGFSGNFNIAGNSEDIGPYDYDSIMHYGRYAFSIQSGVLETITTKPPGISIGNRTYLSDGDIHSIQTMYYADFQLGINTSASEVDPDSPFQSIIDITNLRDATIGGIIAKDVKLTMPLDQSAYVGFSSSDAWSCQQVAQSVECELDLLDRDAVSTLTLNLESPSNLFNINLTPTVSASNLDKVPANNSDSAIVTVRNLTDVAVEITTSNSSLLVGESLDVDLQFDNSSQVDAQQLELQFTTPDALSFKTFDGNGWQCSTSGNIVSCDLASLLAGDTSDLSLSFDAVSGLDNALISATVSSQNNDGDLDNNSKTANVDIINVTDLAVQASASKSSVRKGDSVTVNVDLDNISNTDTSDISVVLTVDEALAYRDFSGAGWSCTNSATTTTCLLNDLAQSATSQLGVRFEAARKTSRTSISVTVSSRLADSDPSNDSASTSLEVKYKKSSSSSGSGAIDRPWLIFLILITLYQCFGARSKAPVVKSVNTGHKSV